MTSEESWVYLRNSGLRISFIALFSLIISFLIYSRLTIPNDVHPVMLIPQLKDLAYAILAITIVSLISIGYGVYRIFKAEQLRTANTNNLMSYITATFSDNKYCKVMTISVIGYAIFFGFISQIFIYRNDISFTQQGIIVPSVNVIPCCDLPGYVPIFTTYLTDHFLILLIPINVILALVVSILAGFNITLNLYLLKLTRMQNTKKISFVGSIGLMSGLFIGCPTCAGSLLYTLLGFSIGTTTVAALAPLQTILIIVSIPALIIAPFLIARGIRTRSTCKLA
jgi:hypothetical protein